MAREGASVTAMFEVNEQSEEFLGVFKLCRNVGIEAGGERISSEGRRKATCYMSPVRRTCDEQVWRKEPTAMGAGNGATKEVMKFRSIGTPTSTLHSSVAHGRDRVYDVSH